jgi:hypothetical protein
MSDAELTCRILTKPALHILEARIPLAFIDRINAYIDEVRARAADYSNELVGQIKRDARSAQLKMDLRQRTPADLAHLITQIGTQYVQYHGFAARVTANDMWTVHSYEGDYNPLHDHGGNTELGLSSILYLKVPAAIAAKPGIEGGAPELHMASGNCDGFTQLVWGANGSKDLSLLRHPTQTYVKPEVGKFLVFPNWLLHRVEPFFGEGERRTLSCNMDVELLTNVAVGMRP